MPTPKRKSSRARIRSRQANKHLKPQAFMNCKNCQSATLPHQICQTCGFYKGKKVLETKMDRALKRGELRQSQQKKMEARASSSQNSDKE